MIRNVRRCTPDDAPRVAEIYNQAIASPWPAAPDPRPVSVASRLAWVARHGDDPYPAWVWESPTDGVMGYSALSPFAVRPDWTWIVEVSLYVARRVRHGVIGTELGLYALHNARRFGFRIAVARGFRANLPMVRATRAFGFRPLAELKDASYLRGVWQADTVLAKDL